MFHIDFILSFLSVSCRSKHISKIFVLNLFHKQAEKCLIEEITHYCTVILRILQGRPCLTFHLNTVITTRLIDRNAIRGPQHTPHPTLATTLHRIDQSIEISHDLNRVQSV